MFYQGQLFTKLKVDIFEKQMFSFMHIIIIAIMTFFLNIKSFRLCKCVCSLNPGKLEIIPITC